MDEGKAMQGPLEEREPSSREGRPSGRRAGVLGGRGRTASRRLGRAAWAWWGAWWWALVGIGALVAFALGLIGFDQYYRDWAPPDQRGSRDIVSLVYQSVQLFVFQFSDGIYPLPPALQVARALAPAMAATTTIQALWPFLRERVEGFRVQHRFRGHVVICGVGRKGLLLARGFRERGHQVVVIEQDPDNNLLETCRALGVITLTGNATDRAQLGQAGVGRARWLFAVTGEDAVNVEAALRARELARDGAGGALTIYAHIFDPHFCALLDLEQGAGSRDGRVAVGSSDEAEQGAGSASASAAGASPAIEFFNIVENGARALLSQYPIFSSPRAFETRRPHLLVVGLGYLGQSLIVQAATAWQGRFERRQQRLPILAVDLEAVEKVKALEARYPFIAERCRLVGQDLDVNGATFQSGAFLDRTRQEEPITSAYVGLGDDSRSVSAGLALRHHLPDPLVPIVVSLAQLAGLARLLEERPGGASAGEQDGGRRPQTGPSGLSAFGLLDRTCIPELLIEATREELARAIHAVYRAAHPSARPWCKLEPDLQESNRQQADHIPVKLAVARCRLAPLGKGPAPSAPFSPTLKQDLARLEHERWNDEKLLDGWEYGEARDNERKLHPDLQPWEKLSHVQQEPDVHFIEQLPAILEAVGLRIEREA